jgi:predicted N-acetyltransferase YhbS
MPPVIEAMRKDDVGAIARLRLAAFFQGSARTLEDDTGGLLELLAGDGLETAFVARIDGMPVGSVLLVCHELEPAHDLTPWLAGLVVAEEHRRKGIGAALVRAVEERAAAAGIGTLYLYTWQARGFYAALGWKAVETFEQNGRTMMLMSRDGLHILPAT